MGDPYFKVKELCDINKVAVFSANFPTYTNISDRVMTTLAKYTPTLEVYSVDEAFLDLSGFTHRDLLQYCHCMKEDIRESVGIPVSVGIGPTKTLAKLANKIAKTDSTHNGVFSVMDKMNLDYALEKTAVEDIWGIGRQSAAKLRGINIKTAKSFRDYRDKAYIQKLLTKVGRQTQDELSGIPCFELTTEIFKKQEIISSRTFGNSVFDLETLRESVANFATLATEKLRAQNSVCSVVEVWIRTNPFKEGIPQYFAAESYKAQSHTSDTRKIIKYAWSVLDKLYRAGYEYKKASVKISGIRDSNESQLSLLEQGDNPKSEALMKTVDKVNKREGNTILKSMACGTSKKSWQAKQVLKSGRFVTGWNELLKVKC